MVKINGFINFYKIRIFMIFINLLARRLKKRKEGKREGGMYVPREEVAQEEGGGGDGFGIFLIM
jgi:hypothetical protein